MTGSKNDVVSDKKEDALMDKSKLPVPKRWCGLTSKGHICEHRKISEGHEHYRSQGADGEEGRDNWWEELPKHYLPPEGEEGGYYQGVYPGPAIYPPIIISPNLPDYIKARQKQAGLGDKSERSKKKKKKSSSNTKSKSKSDHSGKDSKNTATAHKSLPQNANTNPPAPERSKSERMN